jgi:hypothetical protein
MKEQKDNNDSTELPEVFKEYRKIAKTPIIIESAIKQLDFS